jgi:hypothetical protein
MKKYIYPVTLFVLAMFLFPGFVTKAMAQETNFSGTYFANDGMKLEIETKDPRSEVLKIRLNGRPMTLKRIKLKNDIQYYYKNGTCRVNFGPGGLFKGRQKFYAEALSSCAGEDAHLADILTEFIKASD